MKDLTIMVEKNVKLNVRATGVFINNGKILVHKCPGDGHYALPGGRVKATEDSITALKREIKEELDLNVNNTSFAGVVENFFDTVDCKYHEYMWMVKGEFEDKSIYKQDKIMGHEKEKELEFEWMELKELKKVDFRPVDVIPYLENMNGNIQHIITRR